MSNLDQPLHLTLSWCAQQLEKYDQAIWNAVCRSLDKGNPGWFKVIGKSAEEMAVIEIERLYAIERTVKERFLPQSDGEADER